MIQIQTTLELYELRSANERAAVGSPQNHLACRGLDSSAVQDVDQRNAGPLRRADRPQPPLLAIYRRVKPPTTVAGAFERNYQRLRRQILQVAQTQMQWSLHQAAHRQSPPRGIQERNLKMVTDIELRIRHHRAPDQCRD